MAFFTNWSAKVGDALTGLIPGMSAILLSKSDGSTDLLQSDGAGAALVSPSLPPGAATMPAAVAVKTVPTSAAEAVASTLAGCHSVLLVADDTNTAVVYVGGAGVTTATGFALEPGDSVPFEVADPALLYCISGTAAQKLRVVPS